MRIAMLIGCCAVCFGQSAPELPFYDWGACPGEFRCYGEALRLPRAASVYDTYKEVRRVVAQLAAGDKITGIRGVVITFKPGVIRLDADVPDRGLKRGDTLLTYAYRGEGYQAVWFKGKYESEFNIQFSKWPNGTCSVAHCSATYVDWGKKEWWIETRLGWVEMEIGQPSGI
jgi:hypothetical protein